MAYEFILKNETADSESEPSAVAGSEAGKEPKKEKKQLSNAQIGIGKGLVAYNMAKPWINQVVSHNISLVELRTGSREAQQRRQFHYEIASKVMGFGESVLAGFAIGNVPGAIIAGLTSLGHTAITYAQREETINVQRNVEAQTIQRNYIRAGAGGSRRGYE